MITLTHVTRRFAGTDARYIRKGVVRLIAALRSPQIETFIQTRYKGAVRPAF